MFDVSFPFLLQCLKNHFFNHVLFVVTWICTKILQYSKILWPGLSENFSFALCTSKDDWIFWKKLIFLKKDIYIKKPTN